MSLQYISQFSNLPNQTAHITVSQSVGLARFARGSCRKAARLKKKRELEKSPKESPVKRFTFLHAALTFHFYVNQTSECHLTTKIVI